MFSVIVIHHFGWMQGRSRCVVCSCCNKPCFGNVRGSDRGDGNSNYGIEL